MEISDERSPDVLLMEKEEEQESWRESFEARITELVDMARERPKMWDLVKIKMREPEISVRDLAYRLRISPTTVCRHLKEACELMPYLSRVFRRQVCRPAPGWCAPASLSARGKEALASGQCSPGFARYTKERKN